MVKLTKHIQSQTARLCAQNLSFERQLKGDMCLSSEYPFLCFWLFFWLQLPVIKPVRDQTRKYFEDLFYSMHGHLPVLIYLHDRLRPATAGDADWRLLNLSLCGPDLATSTWPTSCVTGCERSLQLPHIVSDLLQGLLSPCFLISYVRWPPGVSCIITYPREAQLAWSFTFRTSQTFLDTLITQ